MCINLLTSVLIKLTPHSHDHKTVEVVSSVQCTVLIPPVSLLPAVVHCTVVNAFEGTFNLKFIPPEQ